MAIANVITISTNVTRIDELKPARSGWSRWARQEVPVEAGSPLAESRPSHASASEIRTAASTPPKKIASAGRKRFLASGRGTAASDRGGAVLGGPGRPYW